MGLKGWRWGVRLHRNGMTTAGIPQSISGRQLIRERRAGVSVKASLDYPAPGEERKL